MPSENNVYAKLIKQLMGDEDTPISYIPHITPDAKFESATSN